MYEEIGVRFTADATGFLSAIKRAGDGLKKLGKEAGQVGAALTAFGGLMVREAAKYDRQVASAVKNLQSAYSALAVEIGRMLLPVVQDLTKTISQLVSWFRSLSPEVKDQIVHWVSLGAAILGIVAVAGKVGSLISVVAGIGAAIVPVLPLALGLAAAFIAVVAVMQALDLTWGEVWSSIKSTALSVWNWLGENFGGMIDAIVKSIRFMIQTWASGIVLMIEAARPLLKLFGLEGVADFGKNLAEWMANLTTESGWKDLVDDAGKAASGVVNRIKEIPQAIKSMMSGLIPNLSGFGGNVSAGPSIADQDKRKAAEFATIQKVNSDKHKAMQKALTDGMKEFDDELKRTQEALESFKSGLKSTALGRSGKVGSATGSAMEGAEVGGIWGALIAVFLDLLTSSKQFQKIIKLMDQGFQMISDVIGMLLQPLIKLSGAGNEFLRVILDILMPIFELLGNVGGVAAPMLVLLSQVFKPLIPVIKALTSIGAALKEVFNPLELVFRGLFFVVQGVGLVLVTITIGLFKVGRWLMEAWNNMIQFLADVIWALGKALGIGGLQEFSNSMTGAKISLEGITGTIQELEAAQNTLLTTTWESADAQAANAAAADGAADAVNEFAESLTNLPTGFKINAARFGAIGAAGGGSTSSAPINITVMGSVASAEDLATTINKIQNKRAGQLTGLSSGGS